MKKLVLFHANCADGTTAAWIAHRYFGDDAEYRSVNYGGSIPEVSGKDVYILDFSWKRPEMLKIIESARAVVVLDHHKTAAEELAGDLSVVRANGSLRSPNIVFNMKKSGGRLAHEFFFPNKTAPWLVDYTEDRDLWIWKQPYSKAVSAAIASYPRDFASWTMFDRMPDPRESKQSHPLVVQGEAILRYQQTVVESQCANAAEIEMDGHKILSLNATVLISEIGQHLARDRQFSATYFVNKDGKKIWSLRSDDKGLDVSAIARKRGGGGHFHAAGFQE